MFFPGSSSRKLAKTLKPKESDRGHLEIAPRQSKKLPKSQSFIREEAPHTTRIPAPLWNKRKPIERPARWSLDRRREAEKSFPDRGPEKDRVSKGYSQEQTFGGIQAGKKVAESNDTRYYAYKQYLERRYSPQPGKCFVSCQKAKN